MAGGYRLPAILLGMNTTLAQLFAPVERIKYANYQQLNHNEV
jgi:hypothetical protein